jgi:hypothetical protein
LLLHKGWFGIPEGLFFSVPVRFTSPKTYEVVEDFQPTDGVLKKIQKVIQVSLGYLYVFITPGECWKPVVIHHSGVPKNTSDYLSSIDSRVLGIILHPVL